MAHVPTQCLVVLVWDERLQAPVKMINSNVFKRSSDFKKKRLSMLYLFSLAIARVNVVLLLKLSVLPIQKHLNL